MNTLEFLQWVMPPSGGTYLVPMQDGRTGHRFCQSLEALAKLAEHTDKRDGVTVYYALATYAQDHVLGPEIDQKTQKPKKKWRVPENKLEVQSFWLDIDCGESKAEAGKGYATKRLGVEALGMFCKAVNLPRPMIVDSGNGLHVYWALTEAISAETWQPIANRLKALTKQLGLLADDTRTADSASILRLPGTHNKKGEHKLVRVVVKQEERIVPSDFNARILAVLHEDVSTPTLFGEPVPAYLRKTMENDTAAHAREYRPADANKIADSCQQMAAFRETGVVAYPIWFAAIGVLKHCVDGEKIAHEWSAKFEGYDQAETQTKLDTYSKAPATCDKFRSDNPAGCAGCKYAGEVKSPITLGTIVDIPVEEVTTAIDSTGNAVEIVIPKLPRGFKFDKEANMLMGIGKNEDGDEMWLPFSNTLFYLTGWTRVSDEHFVAARVHEANGQIRDFTLTTSAIGLGMRNVVEELGKAAVMLTLNKEAVLMVTAYLKMGLTNLQAAAPAKQQLTALGWGEANTEFALGRYVLQQNGQIRMAELAGFAAQGNELGPRGELGNWVDGVDTLYNRENMEPFQYAICAALGSTLAQLSSINNYRGIPLAFTGIRSGTGKTTVCRVALSTMGSPESLIVTGLKNGTTENALYATLGALKNIPFLLDEVTNIEGDELSRIAYAIANGRNKTRMGPSGNLLPVFHWNLASYMTANVDLSAVLANNRQNSEAETLRFIEVYMDELADMSRVKRSEAQAALRAIESAAGTPAVAFLQFCLQNPKDVLAALNNAETFVSSQMGENTDERRFYVGHATCTLAAANIMKRLGIVNFDVSKISQWIVTYINERCSIVKRAVEKDAGDVINEFINENSGHIIVTSRYADAREAYAASEQLSSAVRAPFIGRMVLGANGKDEPFAGVLMVRIASLKEYCLMQRYSYKRLIQELTAMDCIREIDGRNQVNITRGIVGAAPIRIPCLLVDVHKLLNGKSAGMLMSVEKFESAMASVPMEKAK